MDDNVTLSDFELAQIWHTSTRAQRAMVLAPYPRSQVPPRARGAYNTLINNLVKDGIVEEFSSFSAALTETPKLTAKGTQLQRYGHAHSKQPLSIPPRKRKWSDDELAAWAAAHPVGTPVRFWPVRGISLEFEDTTIRSEPWRLGHGEPIVKITGRTSGVALDHLRKIADAPGKGEVPDDR